MGIFTLSFYVGEIQFFGNQHKCKESGNCVLVKSYVKCKIGILLCVFTGNSQERRNYPMLFAPKEKGQGLVEYALILVLVAIVVIAALTLLGPIIGNTFSSINASL